MIYNTYIISNAYKYNIYIIYNIDNIYIYIYLYIYVYIYN